MSNALEKKYEMLASAMNSRTRCGVYASIACDYLSETELNVLSSVPGALVLFAANGMQLWSNDRAKKLLGPEVNWLDRVNPQQKVAALQAISNAARDRKPGSELLRTQSTNEGGEIQNRALSLEFDWFKPVEKVLPEDFALARISDVTAENELEIQLADARTENEAKNEFFSSMSHELRTPLNAIIGFAELLEGKAAIQLDDLKRLEYAGLISGSANHLLGLINDILDLSRLDAGRNVAYKVPVDVPELLGTTVRSLMPIAMNRDIDLVIEDVDQIPSLQTDKRALTQILNNVLSNAIKFSHKNGVVRAKIVRLRNRVKIIITDQGIGMDTETQSKLGGLFYQAGDVVRGDYGGSGLGLSIVYKLVELLGGKIAIRSQVGEGTSVSIMLPIGQEQAMPVAAACDDVVYLTKAREEVELSLFEKTMSTGVKS